jgi:HD-GYP domain-containing protein (c-di-GMP phosphodiesterase class II)
MSQNIGVEKQFTIACSHQPSFRLLTRDNRLNAHISFISSSSDVIADTSIIILDQCALKVHGIDLWKKDYPNAMLIVEYPVENQDCILVPSGLPDIFLRNAIIKALHQLTTQQQLELSHQILKEEHEQVTRLLEVGRALSAERDHHALLAIILSEARLLACCDAASIFLIDRHSGQQNNQAPDLVFKLTQNDSIDFDFEEKRFCLDSQSVAGFSALTGEVLNLTDVYDLPKHCIYKFNSSFDEGMNYRTCSMLVIPMRDHHGRVVGVIQFINRKRDSHIKLTTPEIALKETINFDDSILPILQALASQAAVAIENNLLIDRVNLLFDGFVKASVRAIEQRDPTTSGHSFRVAELTCALATTATECNEGQFTKAHFGPEEMKELKFAALLHDFGKVGVREHILTKAKKLTPEAYGQFMYRIAWEKERICNHYLKQKLDLLREQNLTSVLEEQLELAEAQKVLRLNKYMQAVADANEPSLLAEGTFEHLKQIREYIIDDVHGESRGLIDDIEFNALSIKRGSLTADERIEIESHVSHTIDFLKTIPWTPELSNIPKIAGAHHEKLNGCGYPNGLHAHEIPLGAKIMTVCDIFDALTATDRPYKAAVPLDRALSILQSEVECGHIDSELVQLFSQAKVYKVLDVK